MPDKSIPSHGPGLSLAGLEPFAKGQHRHCYVHPEDAGLCVKVPARPDDEGCRAAQRRDIEDYAWMKERGGAELFDRIPEIEAVVETDRGEGIVMRLYRDADGSISRPLNRLIAERGLPGLVPAIDDWKRWVRRQRLLTRDTGPHNLVGVHLGPDEWKLVIIEGWLKRKYRRLAALHPVFLDRLIDRELRKFDRRAAGRKRLFAAAAAMINRRGRP